MSILRAVRTLGRSWATRAVFVVISVVLTSVALINQLQSGRLQGWLGASDLPPIDLYIPCNAELAQQIAERHPSDEPEKTAQFSWQAWQMLATTTYVLDEMGIEFWLGSGTLLGFYRQCDLIAAMNDVDLEARAETFSEVSGDPDDPSIRVVIARLEERGIKLKKMFGLYNDSFEMTFFSQHDIPMDLFFVYGSNTDEWWIGGIDTDNGTKYRWTVPRFDLCWTLLKGLRVRVPCDPEQYLRTSYGENWHVPRSGPWNYRSGSANGRTVGTWPAELREQVIHFY